MQNKVLFLDGLRGIAAFYVLVGHARWLLWEGFQGYYIRPQDYSNVDKLLMYCLSIFKWGHEFVLLFFVLSGFVIHIGYATKLKQNHHLHFNFLQYFYRRLKRIYPPFLLALLITMVLDTIGKQNNFSIYFGTTTNSLINCNVGNQILNFETLIGNIFFLYKEYFPVFGSNGPSWSLKFECWFYLLYPFFLILSRKHIYYSTILILLLFVASFYPSFWPEQLLPNIFSSMICWWLGVLLAEVLSSRMSIKLYHFSLFSLLISGMLSFLNENNSINDLQTALLFSGLLSCLLWLNEKRISLRYLDVFKPLGDFSYTLYITHFPILVFLSGTVMKFNKNELPSHSYLIFGGMAISLAMAYLLHFLVEIPFLTKKKVAS